LIATIVVGVDGSADSRVALVWAAELATSLGAEVVAVHGRGLLERFSAGPVDRPDPEHDDARARFEHDWCAPLADLAVPSRRILVEAAAVEAVLGVAHDIDADLIVVGRRGAGGAGGAGTIGSTSHQVVQAAHLPVVVVPGVPSPPSTAEVSR
jgi:nucleotide-binding universal stress UspA family protein